MLCICVRCQRTPSSSANVLIPFPHPISVCRDFYILFLGCFSFIYLFKHLCDVVVRTVSYESVGPGLESQSGQSAHIPHRCSSSLFRLIDKAIRAGETLSRKTVGTSDLTPPLCSRVIEFHQPQAQGANGWEGSGLRGKGMEMRGEPPRSCRLRP